MPNNNSWITSFFLLKFLQQAVFVSFWYYLNIILRYYFDIISVSHTQIYFWIKKGEDCNAYKNAHDISIVYKQTTRCHFDVTNLYYVAKKID